ncbi:hypothetical protein RFI_06695 [Reticulomyxa filosa]|uniref:Uncharacterized protein n=1 Tax=Reticulomyxa filosa TaxID=46433 RepID=X6NYT3_RETFI|nr:hypothetical protein RFI_06695 [Reticulomyxa filosa]|eukprot:ETO30427.1 hypothetical protein RFI_06695 [Reticulomyxa filosa]
MAEAIGQTCHGYNMPLYRDTLNEFISIESWKKLLQKTRFGFQSLCKQVNYDSVEPVRRLAAKKRANEIIENIDKFQTPVVVLHFTVNWNWEYFWQALSRHYRDIFHDFNATKIYLDRITYNPIVAHWKNKFDTWLSQHNPEMFRQHKLPPFLRKNFTFCNRKD